MRPVPGLRVGALVLAGGRGSRLPVSGPWGKHMEPVPGSGLRLIDAVLSRLSGADEILVAAGYGAQALQAYLARRWPLARSFLVADIRDLPSALSDGFALLEADVAVAVEGDVVAPMQSMAGFLAGARRELGGLHLLVGAKPARADRGTLEIRADGTVGAVRPVRPDDERRWSVLAAACPRELWARLRLLAARYEPLAGARVSVWHATAARLLAEGAEVRVTISQDAGVNVNTGADLLAAADFVHADTGAGGRRLPDSPAIRARPALAGLPAEPRP